MTRGRLLLGLLVATVVGTVVVWGARRLRRRLVPDWRGAETVLADVVLVVSLLTVVAEVLGTLRWFAPWPLAVSLIAVSGLSGLLGRASPPAGVDDVDGDEATSGSRGRRRSARPDLDPDWSRWAVAAGIGAVAAAWLRGLPQVFTHGIYEWDSVWYHLPVAADFVQSSSFLQLRFYGADAAVSTYPFGSELFQAVGMLVGGSDVLSPLLNIFWAVLFLLAVHEIGRQFRCPRLCTLAGLVVLALPIMTSLAALTALSEMMGLAFLAVSMSFAFRRDDAARDGVGRMVLIGLSLGLMASTKLTMLGPAVVMAVAVILIEAMRGRRVLRQVVLPLAGSTFVTGAFWYLRNWWLFGNPLPEFGLALGPIVLSKVEVGGTNGPMFSTLVDGIRTAQLGTILRLALGPLWIVMLLSPVVVLAVASRRRDPRIAILALGALIAYVMGLMTPQYIWHGYYRNIWSNIRYLMPGIAMSLVLCALSASKSARSVRVATMLFSFLLVVGCIGLQFGARNLAASITDVDARTLWFVIAALVMVAGSYGVRRWQVDLHRVGPAAIGMVALGVAALVVAVLPGYLHGRYRTYTASYSGFPSQAQTLFSWAQNQRGLRIGIEPYSFPDFIESPVHGVTHGHMMLLFTYPLYGPDWSNRVEPVVTFDGTRVVRPSTCRAWWAELDRFEATNVLVWEPGGGRAMSNAQRWTLRAARTREVVRAPLGSVPHAYLVMYHVDTTVAPPCG